MTLSEMKVDQGREGHLIVHASSLAQGATNISKSAISTKGNIWGWPLFVKSCFIPVFRWTHVRPDRFKKKPSRPRLVYKINIKTLIGHNFMPIASFLSFKVWPTSLFRSGSYFIFVTKNWTRSISCRQTGFAAKLDKLQQENLKENPDLDFSVASVNCIPK